MTEFETTVPPQKECCCECGAKLEPAEAAKCSSCESAQGEQCVNCRERMLRGAKYCVSCKSYQDKLRRHFPTITTISTLIGGFIVVCSALVSVTLYVADYHSHTAFRVTGVNGRFLYLKVWNSGRRPSMVVGYHLKFGNLPIEQVSLDLSDADQQEGRSVIGLGEPIKIALTIPKLELFKPAQPHQAHQIYNPVEVRKLIDNHLLTLQMDVEESNDSSTPTFCGCWWHSPFHTRTDTFRADRITEFIANRMAGQ